MLDETSVGPAGTADGRGHSGGGPGEQPSLHGQTAVLENGNSQLVARLSRGRDARGSRHVGSDSKARRMGELEWNEQRWRELPFGETLDLLRRGHVSIPFLVVHGNSLTDASRRLCPLVFVSLPPSTLLPKFPVTTPRRVPCSEVKTGVVP